MSRICKHLSIKAKRYGSTDTCQNCGLPIVCDGKKWLWEHSLDPKTVRKMKTQYEVDRMIGAPLM